MQLAEQEKLDLHRDVNTCFKTFQLPEAFDKPVTATHLLTHTAGFDEQFFGMEVRRKEDMRPLDEYLAERMPRRAMPPGDVFSYSNHGVALAGLLVEQISDSSFEAYIKDNIFTPLGMSRSSFLLTPELAPDLAQGYFYENDEYRLAPFDYSNDAPAGSLITCGADMERFMLAHLSTDGSSVQVFHSMISRATGWTTPAQYAPRLTEACGPFQQCEETGGPMGRYGWVGKYDVDAYANVLRTTGRILTGYARQLAQDVPDWDHLYLQLHANDAHSHRLLGHLLPDFPLATPETTAFAQRMIRENYIETDRILGEAAALAAEASALLVLVSDHSAIPTHTWVDTGRPLMDQGLLHFDADGKWDPTRSAVRQMINHSIYINLKGRQSDGIVEPGDHEPLRDEIISTLMGMRDPKTGACPIAVAARREDMDGVGGNGDGFGDVIYLMRPGYSNQPGSEATRLTRQALADRVADADEALRTGYADHKSIMGNHHDYLPNATYPGFGSNRAVLLVHGPGAKQGCAIRNARTIDVAPTLAWYAGIAPPAQCEGHARVDLFDA